MSRIEVLDKNSGAILFKKDKESKALEKKVKELEERIEALEKKSKKTTK